MKDLSIPVPQSYYSLNMLNWFLYLDFKERQQGTDNQYKNVKKVLNNKYQGLQYKKIEDLTDYREYTQQYLNIRIVKSVMRNFKTILLIFSQENIEKKRHKL